MFTARRRTLCADEGRRGTRSRGGLVIWGPWGPSGQLAAWGTCVLRLGGFRRHAAVGGMAEGFILLYGLS